MLNVSQYWHMRVLSVCLIMVGTAAPFAANAANKVWAEFPLGSIESGIRAEGQGRRIELATIGLIAPDSLFHPHMSHCSELALASAGIQLRLSVREADGLDTVVTDMAASGVTMTVEGINALSSERISKLSRLMRGATDVVKAGMKTCIGHEAETINEKIFVAFSIHECADYIKLCTWDIRSRITPPHYGGVFERVYSWATASQPRSLNEWVEATESGDVISTNTTGWVMYQDWPEAPAQDIAIADLERLVVYARSQNSERISYVVPAIAGLHRETALRFLDELSEPFASMQLLPSGGDVLNFISDELGRSRIKDCAQLRGKFRPDDIGKCAGFELDDAEVYQCLSGQRCLPKLRDSAFAPLLALSKPLDLNSLLKNTDIPRLGIDMPYQDWLQKAQACRDEANKEASVDCLMRNTMDSRAYGTFACARDAIGPGKDKALLECAKRNVGEAMKRLMECVEGATLVPSDMAYCAVEESIPDHLRAAVDCIRLEKPEFDAASCIAGASLGKRQKHFLDCYLGNHDAPKAAVMCAIAPDLPSGAQMTLECLQPGVNWQSAAACIATHKLALDGEFGRVVACGLSSGGTVVGTVTCAAGSHLRPEQAIALQCAATATTGPGYLVCTGGLLTLNEYAKCRKTRIGKDNCFGENNEIRRFIRALGLPDAGPNSIAARMGNLYLDIVNVQIATLEGAAKLGKKAGEELSNAVAKAGKALADGSESILKEGGRVLCRFVGC
ncbi:hypothetical protein [Luteibacter sp. SG786]|uniref:hypothetical protein n=1 Tax=Luteibacter sp. SG786 TaxID=2587130 RepID=UPI001421ABD3|nr:hypothetical protein [Luteibacter sp. SG786]NII54049.1 hypothetical protein [Luteibacter sp. SG786]